MKIVFADAAKADLREIGWWIGADSQVNAERFVQRLVAKARSLDQLALRYPLVGLGDIRKMLHKNYLIFTGSRRLWRSSASFMVRETGPAC